jgi:hypothetical protein
MGDLRVGFGRQSLRGSAFHGGAMERGGPYWFPGSAWEPTALQAPPAVLLQLLDAHGCKSPRCIAIGFGRRSLQGSAFHGGAMERGGPYWFPGSAWEPTALQAPPAVLLQLLDAHGCKSPRCMAIEFGRRSLRGSAFHGGAMERGGPYWFPGSAWEPTALQAPPAVLFQLRDAHGCKSPRCMAIEFGRRSLRGSAFHGGAMERGGPYWFPGSAWEPTALQAPPAVLLQLLDAHRCKSPRCIAIGFGRRSLQGSAFHGGAMERGGPYWFPGSAWEPTALQAPPAVLFQLCLGTHCVALVPGLCLGTDCVAGSACRLASAVGCS